MFSIAQQSLGNNANNSTSDMSISSLSPLTSTRSSSPALSYTGPNQLPSPKTCNIQFGTAEPVEPIILRPLKLEDGEIPAEDQPLLPTPAFTPERPAQISIKIEQFETIHNARETDAKQEAKTSTNQTTNTPTIVPADKGKKPADLNDLDRTMRYQYFRNQLNTTEDTFSERSSGWDSEHDEEYNATWPNPIMTPPEGDDMHPPQWGLCGQHPGEGWELNDPLTRHYFRFLIPDPSTNRNLVAPYISYTLKRENPQVSATYGRGYPTHTRPLRPMAVDYACAPLTPEEISIFDTNALFANAINNIINTYFPYDLSAGVRQYQYYKETQYAIQTCIKDLQKKEMRYMERAVDTLSDLEHANVLGRLLAHNDEITEELRTYFTTDPYIHYARIATDFRGDITQSGHDSRINIHRARVHDDRPHRECSKERNAREVTDRRKQIEEILREAAEHVEDRLHAQVHNHPARSYVANRGIPIHTRKRCFRCGHRGHLRTNCPRSWPKHM